MDRHTEKILYATVEDIKKMLSDLVEAAIQDYCDSDKFEEDACEYCREIGWREV